MPRLSAAESRFALSLIPQRGESMTNEGTTVKGTVTNVSKYGFQLHGREGWLNWSKYAPEPHHALTPGMVISAALDNRGYVESIAVHGEVSGATVAPHPVERTAAPQRVYDARLRLDCLRLAIQIPVSWSPTLDSLGAALDRAAMIEAWAKGEYQ